MPLVAIPLDRLNVPATLVSVEMGMDMEHAWTSMNAKKTWICVMIMLIVRTQMGRMFAVVTKDGMVTDLPVQVLTL